MTKQDLRTGRCLLKKKYGTNPIKNNAACNILNEVKCLSKKGTPNKRNKCQKINDFLKMIV